MKLDTNVAVRLESKGKPEFNKTHVGTVRDCALLIVRWLNESYMGDHMQILIARDVDKLDEITARKLRGGKSGESELMLELEQMLAQPADQSASEA